MAEYEPKKAEKEFCWFTYPYEQRFKWSAGKQKGTVHMVDAEDHSRALCGLNVFALTARIQPDGKDKGEMVSGSVEKAMVQKGAPLCQKCAKANEERISWEADQRKPKPQTENERWQSQYRAYLESNQWRELRYRVLERDGHKCQSCLSAPATEIHHMTYRYYNEGHDSALFLRSVCRPCHGRISEIEGHGKYAAQRRTSE